MIKAGALFYAVIISIVIAMMSGYIIFSAYLSMVEFQNSEIRQRLNLNADSGLNILLSSQSFIEPGQVKKIDLFNAGTDSVQLERKQWGAFEIGISKAFIKNQNVLKLALTGISQDTLNSYSLYLTDESKPLAICGDTKIKGTAYLPKAGIKKATIEGKNYTGEELVYGQIKQSEKTIPGINIVLIDQLKKVLPEKKISDADSVVNIGAILSGEQISNSFLNNTLVLINPGSIKITDGSYSGNIAIISDKQITVSAGVLLDNLILCAPKVILEDNFKGNAQIFSSDSIITGKNVTLFYPSVLGLIRNLKSCDATSIILNENDTISGSVFAYQDQLSIQKQTTISVGQKCIVTGELYSAGSIDMQGTLYGSMTCKNTVLHTSSSVYENHLLNATIDVTNRSKYYVGSCFRGNTTKKTVKWLN